MASVHDPMATLPGSSSWPVRIGKALASPRGVLMTLPLVVIAAGVAILLVGRSTTLAATDALVRKNLTDQAQQIERQVAYALDQAAPMLESLAGMVDQYGGPEAMLPRLHDLAIDRAGVKYVSVSFPDGQFLGAFRDDQGRTQVQTSIPGEGGGTGRGTNYLVARGFLQKLFDEPSSYDPRKRDFYQAAVAANQRVWTRPYPFYKTYETGITCAEPVFSEGGNLRAVVTVDFDVGTLSTFVQTPPVHGARTLVYTDEGTVLAYPAAAELIKKLPQREGKTLHHSDLPDPVVKALMATLAHRSAVKQLTFLTIETSQGSFLASVAPIGGVRAGARAPLTWFVATLVPEESLVGPSRALARRSVGVSAIALLSSVILALVLAWNLVRMRRAVASSRARAVAAESRARDLGSYRLVEKLGTGGMGEVWRAEHRLLVRQAAIKLMRADRKMSELQAGEMRERFRREAQTLASMRSRHTIEIFDYGVTEDGAFFYVMELLDGVTLESLVEDFGPQPAARVIEILTQACMSLAEAHDAGLLHRDVKPANVFLCRAADEVDVVKLLDFGIVHVIGAQGEAPGPDTGDHAIDPRMTEMGVVLGTPGFMAPEQARGGTLDGRADLYALGCVAWLLLTGQEVFERSTSQALLFHHVVEPVPSLARRVPGWIPPALVDVVTACLAKEPEQRPSSARVMAAMLRSIAIPPEHAWTAAKAQTWWQEHVPLPDLSAAGATGRLMVPAGTDPATAPTAPEAQVKTIVGAPMSHRHNRPPSITG